MKWFVLRRNTAIFKTEAILNNSVNSKANYVLIIFSYSFYVERHAYECFNTLLLYIADFIVIVVFYLRFIYNILEQFWLHIDANLNFHLQVTFLFSSLISSSSSYSLLSSLLFFTIFLYRFPLKVSLFIKFILGMIKFILNWKSLFTKFSTARCKSES